MTDLLRDLWWHFQHLHLHLNRYADSVNVNLGAERPVAALKDTPVSGDQLALWKGTP